MKNVPVTAPIQRCSEAFRRETCRRKSMSMVRTGLLARTCGILWQAGLVLAWVQSSAFAATLTVTTNADSGAGSLRNTIIGAASNDTIIFDSSLAGGTITLASELVIDKNLTVDASALSSPLTLSGGGTQRIIRILATYTTTLRGLRFLDGYVPATYGGALYNFGTTTVDKCTFSSNESLAFGGGIANSGVMVVENSTFHDNDADQGGAIYTDSSSSLVIRNSTFANNDATNYGGAIFSGIDGSVSGKKLELFSVTIVGNQVLGVNGKGGGVYNDYLGVPSPVITNSIVAQNTSSQGADVFGDFVNTTSFVGGDPKLSPLGNYGGPTQTMRPLPDSPVIDFVGATTSLTTDQRGQPRVLVGGLDLGAFETAFSDYNPTGVTIFTRVTVGDTAGYFQISTDPDFLPTVTTYAGTGVSGFTNGSRLSAQLNFPSAVATDSEGAVYFADTANHRICMVGTNGQVVTIAGTGVFGKSDGAGATAQFAFPAGVAVGPDGNVYVSDTFNHRICKLTKPVISGGSWSVTTVAGTGISGFANGSGLSAKFSYPYGLALDSSGNIYLADSANHRIRRIAATDGSVSTYAGTGSAGSANHANATLASFSMPKGVAILSGSLYVADTANHLIRAVVMDDEPTLRSVSTFAGSAPGFNDGNGAAAQFDTPSGIVSDGDSLLYVADEQNNRVRKISPSRDVTTVAGTGVAGLVNGKSDVARFNSPTGVAVDVNGNLIVADPENHALRGVAIQPLSVPSAVYGGDPLQVNCVIDVNALGLAPGVTYYFRWVSDTTTNAQVIGQSFYLYDFPVVATKPATNITPTSASLNANVDPKNGRTVVTLEYSTDPNMLNPYLVSTKAGSGVAGYAEGIGVSAQFSSPSGVVTNSTGDIFVADRENHRIRKITAAGVVTTFAGTGVKGHADGAGVVAQFEKPAGLAIDSSDNLYVADEQNHCIRMITPAGVVSTLAGTPRVAGYEEGTNASAKFLYPTGVAVDAGGNVYVADSGNHRIRVITGGSVSTWAGNGVAGFNNGARADSQFNSPKALAIGAGNAIVVADTGNHRIRIIEALSVTTLAGDGSEGFGNGPAANAQFSSPQGIVRGGDGVYYVADTANHRIRMISPDGTVVSTLAGSGAAGYLDSPIGQLHPATASKFNQPIGITQDGNGNIYVTQEGLLRKIARSSTLPSATVVPDAEGVGPRDLSAVVNLPLRYGTTYYFRARATSYRDSITGEILSFATTQAMEEVFAGANTSSVQLNHQQTEVVDFGSTPTGQPVLRSFTIFNPGTYQLTISSVDVPAGFELSTPFGVIPAGTSVTRTISLLAATAGEYSGSVVITGDAPEQPTFSFPISGLALDPPLVTTLSASDLASGTATFNAFVHPMGSSTTVWFEWSQDPEFDGVKVSTLAGTSAGFADGPGNIALFDQPTGLVVDGGGNTFVADKANHRIRKIAPDGSTSTFAGSGSSGYADGQGNLAQFNQPTGIVMNSAGVLFVSDSGNHRIRAIASDGTVSTFSGLGTAGFTDGIAGAARYSNPAGLAIDASGNLYVADTGNHRVRKVTTDGSVSTLAGTGVAGYADGAANVAQFSSPAGIACDSSGYIYLSESSGHAIRRIAADGTTITFAGSATTSGTLDATGASARFSNPVGLAVSVDGSILVADKGNHRIRSITPGGLVKTLAGSGTAGVVDGLGNVAQFSSPSAIAVKAGGGFVVGEVGSSAIRKIDKIEVLVQAATGLTGTDVLSISHPITDLPTTGTYYYRVIATNGGGTTIGDTLSEVLTPSLTGFALWQSTYFGVNAGNDLVAGPAAVPAGDGVPNLLKYAFGLNPPQNSAAGQMPAASVSGGNLSITYTKVLAATDITYTVEWSTDLVNWHTSGVTQQTASSNATSQQILATVPAAPAAAKFIRVRVNQLP